MHVQAKYRPWLIEGNPVLDGTVLMGKSIGRLSKREGAFELL